MTNPKAGLGVLPLLVILGLEEFFQNYYTNYCRSTPSALLGSTPKTSKIIHWVTASVVDMIFPQKWYFIQTQTTDHKITNPGSTPRPALG